MSPSQTHEAIKSMIGRLIETYCLERGIRFSTYDAIRAYRAALALGSTANE